MFIYIYAVYQMFIVLVSYWNQYSTIVCQFEKQINAHVWKMIWATCKKEKQTFCSDNYAFILFFFLRETLKYVKFTDKLLESQNKIAKFFIPKM